MKSEDNWLSRQIVDRFLRYVKIETTSDRHQTKTPSTDCQWDLLRLLVSELEEIGIRDVKLDQHGYLIARIPSNIGGVSQPPVIGFMAHVDTAEDVSGKGVKPVIHENYDGGVITLKNKIHIDPEEFEILKRYTGETVITADGTTLLGADDKAGIAEIMAAAAWLNKHPEVQHGEVELIFTPDEETGKGLYKFPLKAIKSVCCYTLDGDEEGTIEAECFHAYSAEVTCRGIVIHPGSARGKLMNAVTMAGTFLNLLPRNESPEATDERYGYYCPISVGGNIEESKVELIIRDFEFSQVKRRIDTLKRMGKAVEGLFPGSTVKVEVKKQYANMTDFLNKDTRVVAFLEKAIEMEGMEPVSKIIRGGTDGSRLSEMGIPTPNVFTGGANYHSRREWVALPVMIKAARTVIRLIRVWAAER